MYHSVVHWNSADVSEKRDASIFKVEEEKTSLLHAGYFLGLFLNPEDGGDIFLGITADRAA